MRELPTHLTPSNSPALLPVSALPTAGGGGLIFNEKPLLDGTAAEGLKPKQTLPAAL